MPEQQKQRGVVAEQFSSDKISIGWPWHLFLFTAFLFVLSIFVYFGLSFGYQAFLDDRMEEIDSDLDGLAQSVSLENQERFITFASRLGNLKTVLDRHILPSSIFDFLERNTITSGLYFNDAIFNLNTRKLVLKGIAANFDSVARQIAIFDSLPEVQRTMLSDIRLVVGETAFEIELDLRREFIRMAAPVAPMPQPGPTAEMTVMDCFALAEADQEASAWCNQDLHELFADRLSRCETSSGTSFVGMEVVLGLYRTYEILGVQNDRCVVSFEFGVVDPEHESELAPILNKQMMCEYGADERTIEMVASAENCSGPLKESLDEFLPEFLEDFMPQ